VSGTATYLYAITRPMSVDQLSGVRGIGGEQVRALRDGELAVLVSTVSLDEFGEEPLRENLGDLSWLEATAGMHDLAVSTAAKRVTTAPLRMATICLDDDAALGRLRKLARAASTVLARLDNRDEWGVKAYAVATEPAQPVAASARSGTDYLQRRRRQTADRQDQAVAAAEEAAGVYDQLSSMAVAACRHRPQDPQLSGVEEPMLLNAAFLIDRDRVDTFTAAAQQLAAAATSLRFALTGPWPPYSFAIIDEP
jgi:hypothetical protein